MKKNSRTPRRKIREAFAAAVAGTAILVSGCGLVAAQQQNNTPHGSIHQTHAAPPRQINRVNPPGSEPGVIDAFGMKASRTNIVFTEWEALLQRQHHYMHNAKDAEKYRSFLREFDWYKGEPLTKMADNVNLAVQADIHYNDTLYPHDGSYWASPAQTAMYRKGDCKEYASMQYYILLHLGVPENRLFIALVNALGKTNTTDHATLLLNVAPTGQKPSYLVLNDSGPVLNAKAYTNPYGADYDWSAPYKPFAFFNGARLWETHLGDKLFFGPTEKQASQAARPDGLKINWKPEVRRSLGL